MRTVKPARLVALIALATVSTALAAPSRPATDPSRRGLDRETVVQVDGHRSTAGESAAERLARQQALVNWLLDDLVVEGLEPAVEVVLTKADRFALLNPDPNELRHRVGVVKPLGAAVDFRGLDPAAGPGVTRLPVGAARIEKDGGLTWTAAVASEDASALRLELTKLDLPAQARLYVHDLQGAAHGPFVKAGPNGDGRFWTPNVFGDLAVLELRVDGPLTADLLERLGFVIEAAGHSGERFRLALGQTGEKTHCPGNAPCVENAECTSSGTWAPIDDVQDAIAHYQFVSGPFLYICSGGLLADTAGSETPYFLTANHCVSKNPEANSMETYFQYWTGCGSACSGPVSLGTSGADILSKSSQSDYTFLQLDQAAPAGSYFLGWTTAAVAFADGEPLHRISHPLGAPQAYSTHEVDVTAVTCGSWPRGAWIYSRDTYGATEGGSSGSPVTNAAGQVVGQLSGGCGYNVNDVCDNVSNATVDGAFANYFDDIAQWLDVSPCVPSAEICDNGADEDCDGQVDCADSDCTAAPNCADGGGDCGSGGNGADCTDDSDCSSCNCKRGTCRGN